MSGEDCRTGVQLMSAGRLAGIARRPARRAAMQKVASVAIATGYGLEGDHKGLKFPKRGVTILSHQAWEEALAALPDIAGPIELDWTTRRANLLVEGIALPRKAGAILQVGPVILEVTAQTFPCRLMEEVRPGLMKALARDWRGGVSCRVLAGGVVEVGHDVVVMSSPVLSEARLPD